MTREEINYHNRLWYKKTYEALIDKGLNRILEDNIYTEKHHILPKCMGGKDEENNYVIFTAREHIIAHMLLSCMYPDNIKLCCAVIAMTMSSKYTNRLNQRVSTKLLSKFRENLSILQKGKIFSKNHRAKISNAKIGKKRKPFTEDTKNKISKSKKNKSYGTKIIDPKGALYNTIAECSKVYKVSQSTLKYWAVSIPERGFKLFNEDLDDINNFNLVSSFNHPRATKVQGPDGTIYGSLTECARATKHDRHAIANWIKTRPEKGFKYI